MPKELMRRRIRVLGYILVGVICNVLGIQKLHASHNLAGQITATYLGNNTYEITLTTYTDPAPKGVDRCSADFEIWSVGGNPQNIDNLLSIPRINGNASTVIPTDCDLTPPVNVGEPIYGTVKRNIYTVTYTFPGPGCYDVRYFDVARREDVLNMDNPGGTAFYVETRICIPNPIVGTNSTPVMLNDPLDEACTGKLWTHNPGGFDPDGDSLAYELRPSFQYEPEASIPPSPTNGYRFPDDPIFDSGPIEIDPLTGVITWDVPNRVGTFNIAFEVREYRNGVELGRVVRDMAIFVDDCPNNPPIIEIISDTCVTATDRLEVDVLSYDPDGVDSLYLELNNGAFGLNGPFSQDLANPATIEGIIIDPASGNRVWDEIPVTTRNNITSIDTIKGTIVWNTICDNIRTQEYQVDFFAHDNDSYINSPSNVRLTANKVFRVQVIPPPAEGLEAVKGSRQVQLNWAPSACDNALGYRIYRRINSASWEQDTICCEMSPEDVGFELIEYQAGWDNTTFNDSLMGVPEIFNNEICYVVTAMYGDVKAPFIPLIESCATEEVCVEILSDSLYMTNDSVSVTGLTDGEIFLSWSLPDSIDSFFPPPYTFRLFRGAHDQPAENEIASLPFTDTTYTDVNLDTRSNGYNYRVEIFDSSNMPVVSSEGINEASSIFLTTLGDNGSINLGWEEFVPWDNINYEIFRSVDGGDFQFLASVAGTGSTQHIYVDMNLEDDIEYCYFVRSFGSHNVNGIKPELINDSQISCTIASDTFPPCNPMMTATSDCETFTHTVTVTKQNELCDEDGQSITLYYALTDQGPFEPVATFSYASFGADTVITFVFDERDQNFSGCYAINATDFLGNTSQLSDTTCLEFCPGLEMGNVFSPNDDGINDYFTPLFYRDVVIRDLKIYDRWGRLMHTNTTDIEILWDGEVDSNGNDAADGTYYYYMIYEELGLTENVVRELKGWVSLIR